MAKMKKLYKVEWKLSMNKAVEEGDMENIKFLWSCYDEVEEFGYYVLPF